MATVLATEHLCGGDVTDVRHTILRKVEATSASQQKRVFETVKLVSTRRSARSIFKVVLGIVEMQH